MAKPVFRTLGDLTSATTGTAIDVSNLENLATMIGGTFVGTASVEASFDGGTTWVALPSMSAKTAPAAADAVIRCQQIRLNVTAYTSGTIKGRCSGSDEDAGA